MTLSEFHEAITAKVQGTQHLHHTAEEQGLTLDFFTMLSSICGVIGNKGQGNYSAANVFLDAFAIYRCQQGLAAHSIDLGVIEDVGCLDEHQDVSNRLLLRSDLYGINEASLHMILEKSILQQTSATQEDTKSAQLITGLSVPLPEDSEFLRDRRFLGLCFGSSGSDSLERSETRSQDQGHAARAFLGLLEAKSDAETIQTAALDLLSRQFSRILGLTESMEPAKPLSAYGLDSLSAVELRNWLRLQLGSETTTLDILNASSLNALCQKVVAKIALPSKG